MPQLIESHFFSLYNKPTTILENVTEIFYKRMTCFAYKGTKKPIFSPAMIITTAAQKLKKTVPILNIDMCYKIRVKKSHFS